MKKILFPILIPLYAFFNRKTHPYSGYSIVSPSSEPLSRKFGIDRGTPIDRYYIDNFLKKHERHIKGVVLEVGDPRYIKKYGKKKVSAFDVLDIVDTNPLATIIADLKNVSQVKNETYDCIILTQVLGMIDDLDKVVSECHRILKKGGVLLVTSSSISPAIDTDLSYWRFTSASMRYILEKKFKRNSVVVNSYGNVYIGQAFWVGAVIEDIAQDLLKVNDPQYPIIITGYAKK